MMNDAHFSHMQSMNDGNFGFLFTSKLPKLKVAQEKLRLKYVNLMPVSTMDHSNFRQNHNMILSVHAKK